MSNTRHLSTREAVELMIAFGDAYANAQQYRPVLDNVAEEMVRLTDRMFRRLTGKEPSYEHVKEVVPY